eukprot:6686145-Prymnesium_polylepis.1
MLSAAPVCVGAAARAARHAAGGQGGGRDHLPDRRAREHAAGAVAHEERHDRAAHAARRDSAAGRHSSRRARLPAHGCQS